MKKQLEDQARRKGNHQVKRKDNRGVRRRDTHQVKRKARGRGRRAARSVTSVEEEVRHVVKHRVHEQCSTRTADAQHLY